MPTNKLLLVVLTVALLGSDHATGSPPAGQRTYGARESIDQRIEAIRQAVRPVKAEPAAIVPETSQAGDRGQANVPTGGEPVTWQALLEARKEEKFQETANALRHGRQVSPEHLGVMTREQMDRLTATKISEVREHMCAPPAGGGIEAIPGAIGGANRWRVLMVGTKRVLARSLASDLIFNLRTPDDLDRRKAMSERHRLAQEYDRCVALARDAAHKRAAAGAAHGSRVSDGGSTQKYLMPQYQAPQQPAAGSDRTTLRGGPSAPTGGPSGASGSAPGGGQDSVRVPDGGRGGKGPSESSGGARSEPRGGSGCPGGFKESNGGCLKTN